MKTVRRYKVYFKHRGSKTKGAYLNIVHPLVLASNAAEAMRLGRKELKHRAGKWTVVKAVLD